MLYEPSGELDFQPLSINRQLPTPEISFDPAETQTARKTESLKIVKSRKRVMPDGTAAYGLFTVEGTPLLEAPTPELIARLQANPKTEYIPYLVPPVTAESGGFDFSIVHDEELNSFYDLNRAGAGAALFVDFVMRNAYEILHQEFANQMPVGVRGATCSIEGKVAIKDGVVLDINDVLVLGDEQGRDAPNMYQIDSDHRSDPLAIHRSWQWMKSSADNMREESINPKDQLKIFPILIVLDGALVARNKSVKNAVRKIYVYDYPHPNPK